MPISKASSNAVAPAAKGDLVVGTTTNDSGILGVGSNGETLVADSSATTGLRYTAGNAVGNPVLNSAFQVWQRGTSFTGSGFQYAADRWQVYRAVTGFTASRQTTSDTTNLPNIQYAIRLQRDSGNTSTSDLYLAQSLESVNSIPYAGKTVTLSFYARAGANWSPSSGNLRARLFTGTGTDQNVLSSGYTGSASPIDQNTALTTTWTRYSYSATLATNTTELGIYFNATPVGTAGANDWAEVTGVQIDLGSVALPFRTYSATLAGELAAARRYYYRLNSADSSSAYMYFCNGNADTTTLGLFTVPMPVRMRTTPIVGASTTANQFMIYDAGTIRTCTAVPAVDASGPDVVGINASTTGLTAGRGVALRANNSNAGFIDFSAEL